MCDTITSLTNLKSGGGQMPGEVAVINYVNNKLMTLHYRDFAHTKPTILATVYYRN